MTIPDVKSRSRADGQRLPGVDAYNILDKNSMQTRLGALRGQSWSQSTLLNCLNILVLLAFAFTLLLGSGVVGKSAPLIWGLATLFALIMLGSLRLFLPARQPSGSNFRSVPLERVLKGLATMSEVRDTEMRGHCLRVAMNSASVGSVMGLRDEDLQILYWGGLLHDVGKLVVAASTLEKADRLTEAELAEIRRHPAYGADLVSAVAPDSSNISEAIRYHHERWDGLGYPSGLRREDIPVSARIIAVVDVFEALTSNRPYRQPLRPDQALVYVRRCSGTHFDPEVVAAFERLYRAGAIEIADEAQVPETRTLPATPWKPGFSVAE